MTRYRWSALGFWYRLISINHTANPFTACEVMKLGRSIFRCTMPLSPFCRVIRCDIKEIRIQRRSHNILAQIKDLWDNWVTKQSVLLIAREKILTLMSSYWDTEEFVHSSIIRHWSLIWSMVGSWNLLVYTGKPRPYSAPKKIKVRE